MTEEAEFTTTQAREAIESGLRTFRAFEHLHAALTKLESLEQSLIETSARVNAIRATEADLVKGKNDALQAVTDMGRKASEIRRGAEEEAKNIALEARTMASKVLGAAKDEAKGIKTAAQADLDALLAKTSDLKGQHSELDAALKEKKTDLDIVLTTLKQHRESLEKFLKGA